MARPSHLSPDNILRFLQVRTDPATVDDLSRGLHLNKSDRRPLQKMLVKLKKRGTLREFPGGRYHLAVQNGNAKPPRRRPSESAIPTGPATKPKPLAATS